VLYLSRLLHAERVDGVPAAAPVRLGHDRTEDLLAHMRRQIKRHGDDEDTADLAAADEELRERRSRKGGRPRRAR
jgi:hypothetical protein